MLGTTSLRLFGVALAAIFACTTLADAKPARGKAKTSSARHSAKKPHKQKTAAPVAKARAAQPAKDRPANSIPSPGNDGAAAAAATVPRPRRLLSREQILATPPDRLERIGRHVMIGFHDLADVRALLAKRAIAGLFITDHNVRRRSVADIRADIDALQKMRKEQGLPPLLIAADQEGGQVSRLSPPLRRQPSLARILMPFEHDAERQAAVEAYATTQAAELRRLGVTMNFGPVVDLKLDLKNRNDGETRLRQRAISSDPYLVAKAAKWYCDTLAKADIMCTLKHFPGLGRVTRDTHRTSAEIFATEGQLELNDWTPFQRTMARPHVAVMLGHVRVAVLDKSAPASFSDVLIGDVIRNRWNFDGLLITDDFSMGAITKSRDGLGGAAVKALNAGADIILVSFSEKDLNHVLSALIEADEAGDLKPDMLAASRARLDRALVPTAAPTAPAVAPSPAP